MCFYFLRVNGRQQPRTLQIDSRFKVILEVLQEFLTLALHVTATPHQPCRVLMRLCTLLHRKCSGREAWQMPLFLGALGALGDSDHHSMNLHPSLTRLTQYSVPNPAR